jgi:hypothetical protein
MDGACDKMKTDSAASDAPVLTWSVHLLKEQPGRMLLIAPTMLASLAIAYAIFRSPLFLLAVLFLYCSALAEYLFPVRYEINESDASVRTIVGRTFVEWNRVKKCYLDDRGIKLSTLDTPGRLEAYRGVYLRFNGNADEVTSAVRRIRNARLTDGESA